MSDNLNFGYVEVSNSLPGFAAQQSVHQVLFPSGGIGGEGVCGPWREAEKGSSCLGLSSPLPWLYLGIQAQDSKQYPTSGLVHGPAWMPAALGDWALAPTWVVPLPVASFFCAQGRFP